MRGFLYHLFWLSMTAQQAFAAEEVLRRVISPLSFNEKATEHALISGASLISFDFQKSDLEAKLIQNQKKYTLDVRIDMSQVNQAVLPTDMHGRLTKEALALSGRPFIRFVLPGKGEKIVNVNCTPKVCRGLYHDFPYTAEQAQLVKVEVNIRGLKGRNWEINLNQKLSERGLVELKIPVQTLPAPHRGVEQKRLYAQGRYQVPGAQRPQEPLSIDEWQLQANANVDYHRIKRTSLFELHKGRLFVALSETGRSLEFFEIKEGERFWSMPGEILSLKTGGRNGAILRRLEF